MYWGKILPPILQKGLKPMVRRLYYLGKQALAWILLFQFARFLFYVYQYVEDNRQPPTYLAQSAWHGLKMDVSFTGYLLVLPTILMALTARRWEWYRKFLHLYTSVMSVLIASIVTVDLEIYRSWGFRLDATPLRYLSNITEVSASLGSSPLFFLGRPLSAILGSHDPDILFCHPHLWSRLAASEQVGYPFLIFILHSYADYSHSRRASIGSHEPECGVLFVQ